MGLMFHHKDDLVFNFISFSDHVLHGAHGGQKRVSDLLELALQMGANHQDNWEQGSTKALKCWAISAAPILFLYHKYKHVECLLCTEVL